MPWWKTRLYREQLEDYLIEQSGGAPVRGGPQEFQGTRIVEVDEYGKEADVTNEAEQSGPVAGAHITERGTYAFASPAAAGFTVETVYVGQE